MIHPRRLKGKPGNIARYYAVGDYYTKGPEEQSAWGGAIAAELGLTGKVDPAIFKELLAGRVTDQQLGRRWAGGEIEHHPGWDFAVNAPKSVSVMALVAGDGRIEAAHEAAVTASLGYLEDHAGLRRRDKGKIVHETTGRLLFARFTEHASRELDPHLHTHVVILNMTNRAPEDPMASLETRALYAQQMTAGQIYRNELAHRLRELGYGIAHNPRTGLFEIRDVPHEVLRTFSQRAEQIDAHAEAHGLEGQAARRRAFYATRRAKETVGLAELAERWSDRAGAHEQGLTALRDKVLREGGGPIPIDPRTAARATLFGLRQAETREAVNDRGRIIRLGLASHVGEVRYSDLAPALTEHEARCKLLATRHDTGDRVLTRGRTSRAAARQEQGFVRDLVLAIDDARPIADADRVLRALETAGLTPGQERALVDMALTRDRVTAIRGVAGSGKSTLVRVLREAAEPGRVLIALAPTSSAAAELGEKAGIGSRTVASLLAGGGAGITPNHVLVLDEAGQLGNRQAQRVLAISRETGARLLLLGDEKQTGAIERGKAFWLLQRLGMPTAELTETVRQETESMKAAVAEARAGNYAKSLTHLDKVFTGERADKLAKALVHEWSRLARSTRDGTNILVLDNATRLVVNAMVRETLKREGVVAAEDSRLSVLTPAGMTDEEKRLARFYSGGQVVIFARDDVGMGLERDIEYEVEGLVRGADGRQHVKLADENGRIIRWDPRVTRARLINVFERSDRTLSPGDRIQWRLVTHELGLKNAERGTVETLDGGQARIRWDRGARLSEVDLSRYKTWDHGYAETVYSAQSKTYPRVYILAPVGSSLVNGRNYYTAITRARFGVKLWTENAAQLVKKLIENPGEKSSSLEGLGRLDRDHRAVFGARNEVRLKADRRTLDERRRFARDRPLDRRPEVSRNPGFPERLAMRSRGLAEQIDTFLRMIAGQSRGPDMPEKTLAQEVQREPPARPDRGPER